MKFSELVFGIAGPVGIDIDTVADLLENSLKAVGYRSVRIRITAEMMQFPAEGVIASGDDYVSSMNYKIDYANALCRKYRDPATLARVAARAVRSARLSVAAGDDTLPERQAYVIRQLKRPDELELLRQVYGKQFVLISAYGSAEDRRRAIVSKINRDLSAEKHQNEIVKLANDLIYRDASEDAESFGQDLRDTFHMADAFVDGIQREQAEQKINRFIQAFFGRTNISPSKEEYGMYAAKSASLRSADLSRQVGAAIFTDDGELISQGCNEVPKAFGGTYWDLEAPDHRDVQIGHDPNEALKQEILRDLFTRLMKAGLLSESARSLGTVPAIVAAVTRKRPIGETDQRVGALAGAMIMDLTEYGRVVHAEMCAICDAARTGRSVKRGVLYCTTFPCHNCTKHVLAAGVRKVVFMEPYPKSRAKDLHEHEISVERESAGTVSFVPFLGISPFRYRDVFQKGKRKNSAGQARQWYFDEPRPMLEAALSFNLDREDEAVLPLLGDFQPSPSS